ncbi:hypothetical protein E2C01_071971 [Portunus trituberculatus]|uniref:Uncharacterized protein n=1 Tax=Portunus trituberculatus TaxID=210409 RepID=A0A5B7I5W5_PORTR|nr:hypothetical protein [Portunus trituberculatus]
MRSSQSYPPPAASGLVPSQTQPLSTKTNGFTERLFKEEIKWDIKDGSHELSKYACAFTAHARRPGLFFPTILHHPRPRPLAVQAVSRKMLTRFLNMISRK